MNATTPPLSGPACSDWAKANQLDPAGSAGNYRGFLLVEQPLPWPRDASLITELGDVATAAAEAGLRLQLVVEPGGRVAGERRVICYLNDGSGRLAAPSEGWEMVATDRPSTEMVEQAVALPLGGAAHGWRPIGASVVDLLVCTHGSRDTCCGSRGTELSRALEREGFGSPEGAVRVWRTSHTGGHRFAPTAIVLPFATMWAWADSDLLRRVVACEGPIDAVLDRYRGYACLGSPAQQAVERAVAGEVGWPLFTQWRRAHDAGEGLVRLETAEAGTWLASVREGRRVPQPDCRTGPNPAKKWSVEWTVEDLRPVRS